MNTTNNDLIDVIKDMPQNDITLDIINVGDQKFYEYQCNFLIDQIAAYAADVRTVRIDVAYKRVGKNFALLSGKKYTDPSSINNMLINSRKLKTDFVNNRNQEQKDNTILSRSADIFAKTPKISKFRAKQTGYIDLQTIERVITQAPNMQMNNRANRFASDLVKSPPEPLTSANDNLIYSSLISNGKDPASLIEKNNLIQDVATQRQGFGQISQEKRGIANSFTSQQRSTNFNQNISTKLQSQITQRVTTSVVVPYKFRIATSDVPSGGKISIICTIRKKNGALVQKVDFAINHAKQLIKFSIPKTLPTTGIQFNTNNSASLSAFNKDPRVSSVDVYRRYVPSYQSISEQESYVPIKNVPVGLNTQSAITKLSLKSVSNVLIRCVPVLSNGTTLGNFESKSHTVKSDVVAGTVIAVSNMGMVNVKLYGVSPNYKYVQFVRRSITRKQKEWTNISLPIKSADSIPEIEDNTTRKEEVYEYSAFVQDTYGNKKKVRTNSLVSVADYTSNLDLIVTQKSIVTNSGVTTVTFNTDVKIVKDSDTTSILTTSKNLGIEAYFEQETLKLSSDLTENTKINVKRISIDTGTVKDLGVVALGDFEDTTSEHVIYVFEGLVRGQSDLFEEIGSKKSSPKIFNAKDALQRGQIVSSALTSNPKIASLNYTQKFLTKKSLLKGTLSYGDTKDSNLNDSGFLQGRLGITEVIEVASTQATPTITNFNLIVADKNRRLLTFDVQNATNQKNIDFFIITAIKGNVRSVVGACHFNTNNTRQNFLDDKTNLSIGKITYAVTPVGYNGVAFAEVMSQQFEVL